MEGYLFTIYIIFCTQTHNVLYQTTTTTELYRVEPIIYNIIKATWLNHITEQQQQQQKTAGADPHTFST